MPCPPKAVYAGSNPVRRSKICRYSRVAHAVGCNPSEAGSIPAADSKLEGDESMCTVSMIGDHYRDTWFPGVPVDPLPFRPFDPDKRAGREDIAKILQGQQVTRAEFDALKREVENMRELLKRAVDYDKRTGQEHCETDSKVELLKKIAKAVGIDDIEEILKS